MIQAGNAYGAVIDLQRENQRLRAAARRFLDHLEPHYEPSVDEMTPPELDHYVCHPFAVAEFSGVLNGSGFAPQEAKDGDPR